MVPNAPRANSPRYLIQRGSEFPSGWRISFFPQSTGRARLFHRGRDRRRVRRAPEEESGFGFALLEHFLDADHGNFDHVGCGALNGGVNGVALGAGADHLVAGVDVADVAAASRNGLDEFVLLCKLDGGVEVVLHTGIVGAVLLDDILRLPARNAKALCKAEGGDAIDDAKVHHLGLATHFAGDVGLVDAKDARSGGGVDVFAVDEGIAQSGIARKFGHDAQLNLGIVAG